MNRYISVVIPTYRHAWELDKVMISLEKQTGIYHHEYEILIINDDPEDKDTLFVALENYKKFHNVRYVEVYDAEEIGITNAGRCGNVGARSFASGNLLILVVDSGRIPTPGCVRKTRDMFERYGSDITTTVHPYHIGKHYSDKGWTVEECRNLMKTIRWDKDAYHLFSVAAHTRISKTGVITESTFQGITKENFLKIGGWNEEFKTWGSHNLDLWRRCFRSKPIDGIQKIDVPDHWGKVGLGLEVKNIEGEGTFHIHHDITVPRILGNIKKQSAEIWELYKKAEECIVANTDNPNWGKADCKEIDLSVK